MLLRPAWMPTRTSKNSMADLVLVLTVTAVVTFACADAAVAPTATGTPTSVPAAMSTLTQEPAAARTFDDPRELASFLIVQANNGDWAAVQAWLVDDFQRFDDYTIQRTTQHALYGGLNVPGTPESADWDIEEHAAFTTLRLRDEPIITLIFRRNADGAWRFDPGPHALYMAKLWEENPELSELIGPGSPEFARQLTSEAEDMQVFDHFIDDLASIMINGDEVMVTFEWMFRRGASGEAPLAGLRWTAGEASGSAHVAWTTAVVANDHVAFPPPARDVAESETTAYRYMISFQLEGVPNGEELYLQIDRMTLKVPVPGELVFSIDYHLPSEEYPQPAS